MIEDIEGRQCEWHVDIDNNKVCIDMKTGHIVKTLPPSITSMGVVIQPLTTYRAILMSDFVDIYGNTHPKGSDIKVNEMCNGVFFMTLDSHLISTEGKFDQFSIIVEYEKIDSITLHLLLENTLQSEDYKEAAKIKKELDGRGASK